MTTRGIAVLGVTGSIGRSTCDVIERFPERLRLVAAAAGSDAVGLAEVARRHRPELVAIADEAAYPALRDALAGTDTTVMAGREGILACATAAAADVVVGAIVGGAGLEPTLATLSAGKVLALANKESLVAGGPLVERALANGGGRIIPVDSEHSALFQCLEGRAPAAVQRLILTASGGPFFGRDPAFLEEVTPEQALRHPNWSMGPKVTIDSATLINKVLEVIEAHWLFSIPPERISVVIHPQSIIHSMVEFVDGQLLAQLGPPDMRLPIAYALTWPERLGLLATPTPPRLDLAATLGLQLHPAADAPMRSLDLAYQALAAGGTMPAVLNAADEIAVQAFLAGQVGFMGIVPLIEQVMAAHQVEPVESLEQLTAIDQWARQAARAAVSQ